MAARDPSKASGYYCDGTRHKAECPDRKACDGCLPPCSMRAGQGTDHVGVGRCSRHLGSTRNHKAAAEVAIAKQAVARYGLAVDIDPAVAMMRLVAKSYGSVLYLEAVVAELGRLWSEDDGGGKPHVAWVMLMAERKLLADVTRDALRAGVERRALELMEDEARRFNAGLEAFIAAMRLDRHSPQVISAAMVAVQLLPGGTG